MLSLDDEEGKVSDEASSSLDKCVKCLKTIFKGTNTLFVIDDRCKLRGC